MAVSPVGSQIYVNQAAPLVSQLQQTVTQRFDMQAFVAAELEKNKEPSIEPVSESNQYQKIDADAKGGGQEEQYEGEEKGQKEEETASSEPKKTEYILDLKV